jgi:GMP synthase (glutamine-hydrolysing)
MNRKIIIVDFGSQFTQLIARRVREQNVYCEIVPFYHPFTPSEEIAGVILSGSPASVNQEDAPDYDVEKLIGKVPLLGICYGAQLISKKLGGKVENANTREYGRAMLVQNHSSILLHDIGTSSQVWMSHGDTITELPKIYRITGSTEDVKIAAFEHEVLPVFGVQFHPEVSHSTQGAKMIRNFLYDICGLQGEWTPAAFIETSVAEIRAKVGDKKVICGLSGGVDSTVAATLVHRAIGHNQTCIFVDNGLLRKNEFLQVQEMYKELGLNVIAVDASEQFLSALAGISDPELKRKAIGRVFIEVFEAEAKKIEGAEFLVQGTIYPDVIESVSVKGPSVTIKSHHNVGGLPEKMNLKVVEPLQYLFKDEVRKIGIDLGLSQTFIGRHPFPGPGLAIRILSDITQEKVALLQEADAIFIQALREHDLYDKVWQAFVVLLPVQSVGVMGDERTYENCVVLRSVGSSDGMTADWSHLPYEFLAHVSGKIINSVRGINRVVYDISSKPPATIEWE